MEPVKANRFGRALLTATLGYLLLASAVWSTSITRIWNRSLVSSVGEVLSETYYPALARSILQGRLDVPEEAIAHEAFIHEGKFYGYFGPVPALMRIPLILAFPGLAGSWTPLFVILSAVGSLLVANLILFEIWGFCGGTRRREQVMRDHALYNLAAIFSLSFPHAVRHASLFHEAASVGVFFCLCSALNILRYWTRGRKARSLMWAGGLALLAAGTRGSVGLPILLFVYLMTAILVFRGGGTGLGRHLSVNPRLAAVVCVLSVGMAALAYRNHVSVGNLTGAPNLDRYVQTPIGSERYQRTNGSFSSIRNVPTNLYAYLRLDGVRWTKDFPYMRYLQPEEVVVFRNSRMDFWSWYASASSAFPFWILLALLSLASVWRMWKRQSRSPEHIGVYGALGSTLLCCGPILLSASICFRYLHDWAPFLLIAGAVALVDYRDIFDKLARTRIRLKPVVAHAVFYSVFAYSCYAASLLSWLRE